jgi:chemosensory pili system protein ChpA (sensor histidine kinase/response regulator)
VQLARNSLVHGLEPPDERQRLGKPALATLQLAVRKHPETRQLEVVFQDDGAGLDYAKIARRARERGLPASPEDLPRLIFESGFSTAEEATLDAGRGVGLDVVRAEVERRQGRILPHSQTGKFCAFQILLPWESHEAPDRR